MKIPNENILRGIAAAPGIAIAPSFLYEKLREEIKQKARADADAIVREAQRQIETETGRALRQIRSEIAEMSVAIASKLIQRNFTSQDNSELIEETLKQMESGTRPS